MDKEQLEKFLAIEDDLWKSFPKERKDKIKELFNSICEYFRFENFYIFKDNPKSDTLEYAIKYGFDKVDKKLSTLFALIKYFKFKIDSNNKLYGFNEEDE